MSLASNGYFHGIYYSPFIDELTMDLALEVLASKDLELGHEEQPDVFCLSLSGQDTVSHAYGPESEENLDTLRRLDVQLGRLFEALDRGFPEGKVVLALSADHGFQTIPELEARRDKTFTGGRVLSGNGAVTNFEERLNRYLCEELCLPLDAKPIFGNEGFDLKYNLPVPPGHAHRRRALRRRGTLRDARPTSTASSRARSRGSTTRSSGPSSSPRSGRAGTRPTATSASR